MTDVNSPIFTEQVDTSVFLEPLGGPNDPLSSLERFPDALYNKSPETHFIRFMYSLLGGAGVGWIKQQYLEAKLELYAQGFSAFNIEKYYGDPFQFGRILEEQLPEDPEGLLTREEWETIKVKDESYRSRAITFFNAVRAGGTPEGIELAAQSGLNHSAFVVENYKYLFDQHSDEPLGLPYYGQTLSTEEFSIVPRQDSSQTEQQIISFAEATAKEGTFQLIFNGEATPFLPRTANQFEVETALQELKQIGKEGVLVSGGSNPNPFVVTFAGPLSNQKLPTLEVISRLKNNLEEPVAMYVRVLVGGVDPVDEVVVLSDEYQHNAQTAVDYIRPMASLPTPSKGSGTRTRQQFSSVHSSSNYTEAIKFVTGSENVKWPEPDSLNWIEPGKEKESKRIEGDLQAHYTAYHTISGVTAYTDEALEDPEYAELMSILEKYKSEHIGRYDPRATEGFPFLAEEIDDSLVFSAKKATPPCSIPMEITTNLEEEKLNPLIESSLYAAAIDENGSGEVFGTENLWWSSLERHAPASDLLEIDMGQVRVVNWITFEITRKPCLIELDYDRQDMFVPTEPREFIPVTLWTGFYRELGVPVEDVAGVAYDSSQPPWQQVKVFFHDQNQMNIASRYLRLIFKRPAPGELLSEPFVDPVSQLPIPYSIDVRNLRVGRYAGASPNWNSV
jgi:hypothetical protein